MNAFFDAPAVQHALAWLGTFALHSTCALGFAWLFAAVLQNRAIVLQERLLRLALFAAVATSLVQCFLLGGPWHGAPAPVALAPDVAALRFDPVPLTAVAAVVEPPVAAVPWPSWLGALAVVATLPGFVFWWRTRRRLARLLGGRCAERDPRVLAIAADVAADLGWRRPPRLSRSAGLVTPIAFGWPRGEVALPARVDELDAASLRALLAHEFAHLRRRDPAVLAAVALLQALFPWQLLLPLVRRHWLRLVELRCDAIAAERSSPTAVARCLLEVAGWLQGRNPAPRLALGMAARPSALRDRVEAALSARAGAVPRRLWSMAFGSASLSALAVVGPGVAPADAPTFAVPIAIVDADDGSPATPATLARDEYDLLAAEVAQLRADLAGRPLTPELEQLLLALERRLLVVERLAWHIERRAERF